MADPYDSLNLLDLNINPPSERPGNTRIPNQQNQNEQPTSTTSVSPGPWRSAPTQQNENEQSTSTTTRSPGPWRSDPLLTPTPNQQKENEPPNSTTTTSPGPWRSARVLNKQKENEPPKSGGTHYNDLDTFEQQIRTAEPPRPDPGTQVPGPYSGPPKSGPEVLSGPNLIVRDYLRAKDPTFHGCDYLRDKGWRSTSGDQHFRNLQASSDNAALEERERFYKMFKEIGQEMHAATKVFTMETYHTTTTTNNTTITTISLAPQTTLNTLHLCMAPGGFTWVFLEHHPTSKVCGITLPPGTMGGHPVLLPHGFSDRRVEVQFLDLTMLATEYGVPLTSIPTSHPEHEKFSAARPFDDVPDGFSLVICDGQVLRTHPRADCRRELERTRLMTAQLILGMQRIRQGGTFVILLHKVDAYDNVLLLRAFDSFSRIELFKPAKKFAVRSSFYLVAKDVRPNCELAKEAVIKWKEIWFMATFGGEEGTGVEIEDGEEVVREVLDVFGERLIKLGRPIWKIQRDALHRAEFFR